jgi:hypothetical protein
LPNFMADDTSETSDWGTELPADTLAQGKIGHQFIKSVSSPCSSD